MNLRSFRNRLKAKLVLKYGCLLRILRNDKDSYKGNNIIIFHQGRCGSTLLEQKITGSPSHQIKSFSEIYSQSYIPMESGLKNMITSLSQTTKIKNKFYEVKYGQENHLSFSMEKDLNDLVKNDCKFLLIVRRNSLSQAKSTLYGLFRNKDYHFLKNMNDIDFEKITIKVPFLFGGRFYSSLNELSDYIDYQTKMLIKFLDKIFAIYEIIYYEDIVNNNSNVENSISKLLGINDLVLSNNIKTIKTPINYDEKLLFE